MSPTLAAWVVIVAAGVGTFVIRASFLVAGAGRADRIPGRVRELLRMIPPAALAALVTPALFRPEGSLDLLNARLLAGIIALAVAARTRSILPTISVGMLAVVAFERIPGLA